MKIIRNVLSPESLKLYETELIEMKKKECWRSSQHLWDKNLLIGTTGQCHITDINGELKSKILNDIVKFLPTCDTYNMMFYLWDKNSGIAPHADFLPNRKFGATIYMNDVWHVTDGGLFLYTDKTDGVNKYIKPEFNMMVLNDTQENHFVTLISPLAENMRKTIQIWGDNLDLP